MANLLYFKDKTASAHGHCVMPRQRYRSGLFEKQPEKAWFFIMQYDKIQMM